MIDLINVFNELMDLFKILDSVENNKKYLSEEIRKTKDSLVQAINAVTQTINKEIQNKYQTKNKIF